MQPALKEAIKPLSQVMPHRCHLAQHERREFRVYPEPNQTKQEVLSPDYWAHVSKQFRVGDKIEILAEDGSYYAETLVVSCSKLSAKLFVLFWHELQDKAAAPPKNFSVEWKGPVRKFGVVRESDSGVVQDGFQTRDEANSWLEQNIGNLAT